MKKIGILAVLSGTFLVTSGEATELFVGIEQSHKRVENNMQINDVKEKHDKSLNITSLKVGVVNGSREEGDRYEFLYNFGEENIVSGLDTVDIALHYNCTLPSLIRSQEFLPYLRLGASYSRVSEKKGGSSKNPKYDAYGYILGLGTYYLLENNLEFSLGLDYDYKRWNTLKLYQGAVTVNAKTRMKKAYIGLNYLF